MRNHFGLLENELPMIKAAASSGEANGFFGQEALRFYSIAGTLLQNFKTDRNATVSVT
jgi:hypothetical protein